MKCVIIASASIVVSTVALALGLFSKIAAKAWKERALEAEDAAETFRKAFESAREQLGAAKAVVADRDATIATLRAQVVEMSRR